MEMGGTADGERVKNPTFLSGAEPQQIALCRQRRNPRPVGRDETGCAKNGAPGTLIRLVDDFASFHNDRGAMFL
jgi:hypothetical protein